MASSCGDSDTTPHSASAQCIKKYHGYERIGSVKERFKSPDFSIPDFSISDGVLLGHNVFDELPHSTNNCVLQLGYHMPISDSGGGFYNDAIVVVGFEFYYLMGIRDKGGGYLIISEYQMVLRFVRTKLPMVMRSGYLNRLVFQRISVGRDAFCCSPYVFDASLSISPGGAKVSESVVKFCYGWTVDLTAANIALLYCAAHFLGMSDDFEQGNLISKTETFLSFLIFSSWKDTFRILRGCESISLCAKELKISKQSAETIAWKACTNLNAFSFETDEIQCFAVSAWINYRS
ncbi:root phototropism protein 3-like [Pyrus ussuriensis x Pyrus communis]|uniref:Root phototropism protein 3-like n=1 Tax=Pyrus ussuriensis x Pyrus communis TaxID=2448454 RepID=A0A5N5FNN9_9ROSA|nr:root phototropism protein 3-like [Pyrus ussuriensis x Pyrus communis]